MHILYPIHKYILNETYQDQGKKNPVFGYSKLKHSLSWGFTDQWPPFPYSVLLKVISIDLAYIFIVSNMNVGKISEQKQSCLLIIFSISSTKF